MPLPPRPISRRRRRAPETGSGFQATTSSLIAEARSNMTFLPSGASAPNNLSGVYVRPRSPMYHPRPALGVSPLAVSPLGSPSSSLCSRLSTMTPKSASPSSEAPIEDFIVPGGRPARNGPAMTMGFDLVPDLKGKVTALDDGHKTLHPEPAEPKTGFWAWTERSRSKGESYLDSEPVPPTTPPPLEDDAGDDDWEHVQAYAEAEDEELCIVGELELDDQEAAEVKASVKVGAKPVSYASALAAQH